MSIKYNEAFDSLGSDDVTKRRRTERVLYSQSATEQIPPHTGAVSAVKVRRPVFSGKRGVALIMAMVLLFAMAISVPLGIILYNNRGLLGSMSRLKNTFVDMDDVAAFGVWNAPEDGSSTASITNVSYVRKSARTEVKSKTAADDDILTGEWSDDERYDWESDYDWDPTKANVLIAISEEGKISEVVYERTNGRGQVRQDKLGNAAAVYVSDSFTYVMYVDDDEWAFWQDINFAQEMCGFNGFHCHHEMMQTVVIHNETGKVFALKDLIPQVNELSGAINYTMQVEPCKNDFLFLTPMYGNGIPQWYNVIYDEQMQKIRYESMVPAEAIRSHNFSYFVRAARRDKYGQQYLLESYNQEYRICAGIIELPIYTCYGNTLMFSAINGIMAGTDGRMYAFDGGKLKVFGENFGLSPVEAGTEVAFEGIANEFLESGKGGRDGIAYKLKDGYLYSMFGEVWKVDDDGTMHARERLVGSFPRYSDDGFLIGGEIIAFVDTGDAFPVIASVNGRIVQLSFDSNGGTPRAEIKHIIKASEIHVRTNNRMVVEQNENPYKIDRGEIKRFLITVKDGMPSVEYIAYGYQSKDDYWLTLTKPITQPLELS